MHNKNTCHDVPYARWPVFQAISFGRFWVITEDRANQEAAWQAVVKVSGLDFSSGPAPSPA